jgi:membrane-associated phospholipid phosphatase
LDASWLERIATDVHDGMAGVTQWYDAPLFVAFLARNYYKADNPSTKLISYPATAFEQRIAEKIGVTGQESPGSMAAWLLPGVVLGGRVLWAIGSNIAGEERESDEYARSWTFARALMYNFLATELVKNVVSRPRPDATDTKSFFSGHTSTAFATGSYLYREVDDLIDRHVADATSRDALKAFSFGVLYGWAGYVGYSRLADNKHYLGDVLLGAAVGTLMGNVVFDQYFGGDGDQLPTFGLGMIEDQPALSLSLTF